MTARRKLIVVALVVFAMVSVAANMLLGPTQSPGSILKPSDPEVRTAGVLIYAEQCAACHGQDLEGQPNWRQRNPDGKLRAPPHGATGHTWHHPDETLFSITKFGAAKAAELDGYQSDMPVYAGVLTDDEIIAVLSYIKSTWPVEIRERHDAMNVR